MILRHLCFLQQKAHSLASIFIFGFLCGAGAPASAWADVKPLLQYVPDSAKALAAIDLTSFTLFNQLFDKAPEMKRDLSSYLERTMGVDLTEIKGVALFLTNASPEPTGAVFLQLKKPGSVRGKKITGHRGVTIISLEGKKLVAASVRGGLVLGDLVGVKRAIDLSQGKARPLGVKSQLATVLENARSSVQMILGIHASSISEIEVQDIASRFGLQLGILTFDKNNQVMIQVYGEISKMRLAMAMLEQLIKMADTQLLTEKKKASAQDEVLPAVGAIMGYHQWRSFIKEAQPREQGGRIVSTYKVPELGSPLMVASMVGILAAVAIPSFIKYTRKAKTVEATEVLDKINAGAKAFFQADHYDPKGNLLKKHFPHGNTGWVPAQPCCKQAGGQCKPDPRVWARKPWKDLSLTISDPHYYQYRYTSQGENVQATFTVEARGDLDCDGTYSNYKLIGTVDKEFAVQVVGPIMNHEME